MTKCLKSIVISKKKQKIKILIQPDFNTYYKAPIIKMVCEW